MGIDAHKPAAAGEFAVREEHGTELPARSSAFEHGETHDLVGCPEEGAVPLWIPRG